MAGVVFHFDDANAVATLNALAGKVGDISPLMAEIGEIIVSQAQDSFENQAAPDGTPWKPSQRALREGGQTLIDSGGLRGSLASEIELLPDAVIVGTSKIYGAIHQLGGKAGRGHATTIEARPFLPDADTVDMPEIWDAIEHYIERALQ